MTALAPLDIYIDNVNLNTYAAFVTTRNGWDSTPGLNGANIRIPGRDGEISVAKDYGTGRMVLQLTVTGTGADGTIPGGMTEATQFRANMDALLKLFSARGGIQVSRTMEDASVRTNYGEVGAVIAPEYIDGANTANLTVEIIFPDPFWVGTGYLATTPAGSSTNGRRIILDNLAGTTAPINDAIFTFVGPATNPGIRDEGSDSFILYNGTLASGQHWRVDAANFRSEIGTGIDFNPTTEAFTGTATSVLAATQFTPGPRFFSLTPYSPGIGDSNTAGTPAIIITGTSLGSTSTVKTYARKKFIA